MQLYCKCNLNNSYLVPDIMYAGQQVRVYVSKTSTYSLVIAAWRTLIKLFQFFIAPGSMVELVGISTNTTFIGWYLIE